jgi:DnaJ-domain-containing protein 1
VQVAGLPFQLAAIFTGCPDYGAKLTYLRDILDLDHVGYPPAAEARQYGYKQHADPRQHAEEYHAAAVWDGAASLCGAPATAPVARNPLTARYLAALLTKELAERCEILR